MTILNLKAVEMTEQIMESLEKKGLIMRLCPGHDELDTPYGETLWKLIYEPKEGYGPHRLITVTVNREEFAGFGTHPDNEEFWLLGDSNTQPMYLIISFLTGETLAKKISDGTLQESDFITLHIKYNDPSVSFFVMRAGVPHGEAIVDRGRRPPSFYVTESLNLPLNLIPFGNYQIKICDGEN
ncbi:hypothetical protein LQZ21_04125 [Treponema sp. TIM-1]|uniref:hypothetical protein n=1 Tax=Treponema sp. TIM-1 TaxID=2898417 RepID=UPI00397F1B02